MTGKEYQELSKRTLDMKSVVGLTPKEEMLLWCMTGLAGEIGEVVEHVKKGIFHKHEVDKEELKNELGDVLWYLSGLAEVAGISLEDIMTFNVEKLKKRYPDGFDISRSKNKND